jgi:hypothetical protein
MSEPDASLTPAQPAATEPAETAEPAEPDGGVLSALADALSGVVEGLKGEPVLLAGTGAMVLVEIAGLLRGGAFLLVALLVLGAYLVSLAAHLWIRRSARAGRTRTRVTAVGTRDARVRNSGGSTRVRLGWSRGVSVVSGPGPAPALEPAAVAAPAPAAVTPAPVTTAGSEEPPARRERYTRSLTRPRDELLEQARAAGAGGAVRFEVVADSGCGKTKLLEEVAAGLKADGRLVLFITAEAPEYGTTGTALAPADREAADYATCRRLVDAIAADVTRAYCPVAGEEPLLDPVLGQEWADALRQVRMGRPAARPGDVHVDIRVNAVGVRDLHVTGYEAPAPASPAQPLSRLAAMQDDLARVLDGMAAAHPVALLVDDVHNVVGTAVEPWLRGVARGMSAGVVGYARRPAAGEEPAARPGRIVLGRLPRQEAHAFVADRLADAGWRRDAAAAAAKTVADLTRGHPIGVAIGSAIVRDQLPPDSPPERVRSLMLSGDGAHWDDAGAFGAPRGYVDGYAAGVVGRRIALFDLLTVLRRCTAPTLAALLARTDGVTERQADRLYDWLSRSDLVSPFDDDVEEGWRLHDYLRENAERNFRLTRPRDCARLHAEAERYYRAGMNFDTERDEESPHTACARYEDPAWQRDSKEWLHHAAHAPREHFASSVQAMIRLFMEAFYWWDAEVPSSYCDQLLSAYRALPADRDLRWAAWLDALRGGYVAGRSNQIPGRDRERWRQARDALEDIADYLRLRRGRVPSDPDRRRVYIVYCQLRGDVARYGGSGSAADLDRAAEWFRASLDACTDDGELWMGNWAAWSLADVRAATEPARARALLAGLEQRIADEDDNELPVWLAGTLADIAWAENDPARAFDAHVRAVLRAFVYHVRQEVYGQYPNRYSDSVHRSVLAHLRQCERRALDEGLDREVEAARRRSRALFAPYWRYVGGGPGDGFGLPGPPESGDLDTDRSDFARAAKWVLRNMGEEVAKSVEDPLPDEEA